LTQTCGTTFSQTIRARLGPLVTSHGRFGPFSLVSCYPALYISFWTFPSSVSFWPVFGGRSFGQLTALPRMFQTTYHPAIGQPVIRGPFLDEPQALSMATRGVHQAMVAFPLRFLPGPAYGRGQVTEFFFCATEVRSGPRGPSQCGGFCSGPPSLEGVDVLICLLSVFSFDWRFPPVF